MTSEEINKLKELQEAIERVERQIKGTHKGITISNYDYPLPREKYSAIYDEVRELILDHLNAHHHALTMERDRLVICTGEQKYKPIDITK